MNLIYLLIGTLLLVLVVGMQLQMKNMIKKLDELTDIDDESKEVQGS
jgi:hypothetical protein